ncbi:MAG TPA: Rieske (2Fe-2S) protein [Vicinamibacterales bacterium]|nr:Rieske (2Fe-2S) protein [Vicinamibacterales bacterium]
MSTDPGRERLDARIDSPNREGLTGTAPANMYGPLLDPEQVTIAPDGRPSDAQPAWRSDFPIDWPQDHYVERRDFMKFMVLTSLAFTVGQFWIAAQNWIRRRRGAPQLARLASTSDIPVGDTRVFAYPTEHDPCVLVRTAERSFVAYSQKCTHLSCAVIPDVKAGVIRCPCHDGLFDLASGRPLAGPPRRPLSRIALEFQGDQILASGVEARTV